MFDSLINLISKKIKKKKSSHQFVIVVKPEDYWHEQEDWGKFADNFDSRFLHFQPSPHDPSVKEDRYISKEK